MEGSVAGSHHHAQLMLCLQNYSDLSQQLNSKSFRGVNQRLEQQLLGVMALYSGKILHAEQQTIHVQFSSNESNQDAAFKGLCAALLLLQLNAQPTAIPMQITALMYDGSDGYHLLKRLPYFLAEQEDYKQVLRQLPDNTSIVQKQLLEEPLLAQRFISADIDQADDVVLISSVQQTYQDLLDKQLQQLSRA
jgi:hypothetical protein